MKTYTALLHYLKRFFFQFKRYGTDVEKNARDPYGDGDQRCLKGFEGTMVSCLSSALHACHTSHSWYFACVVIWYVVGFCV
jgi:hypothetical protein